MELAHENYHRNAYIRTRTTTFDNNYVDVLPPLSRCVVVIVVILVFEILVFACVNACVRQFTSNCMRRIERIICSQPAYRGSAPCPNCGLLLVRAASTCAALAFAIARLHINYSARAHHPWRIYPQITCSLESATRCAQARVRCAIASTIRD